MRGIPLGAGVTATIAWIPNKGLVDCKNLTNEEIKILAKNYRIK